MSDNLKVIFFADLVGKPGRQALSQLCRPLKERFGADLVIANVENVAGGFGVTPEMSRKIFRYGVDVQTSGNHIWDRVDIISYIKEEDRLLRPANFPGRAPGKGSYVIDLFYHKVGVINLMGRTFMKDIDCPFRTADRELEKIGDKTKIIIVDMHAEATSEKQAMWAYLDGRVSAVIGTHTHVQTADETISEEGTAYISDVGMSGPHDSILGMKKEAALGRFLTGMPKRMSCADGDVKLCGVALEIEGETGRALSIERIKEDFNPLDMDTSENESEFNDD
ncbi:MAG: TIGR00282 family metallophosphoesterase [candidate division Zixibacteria bacterium]|nr:TIGR00282 family metallophosphoesterase [candidate division Zixibacteria bacterium]